MKAGARIAAAAIAGAAALTLGLGACSSAPSGLHNMRTLEQSMTTKYSEMNGGGPGNRVDYMYGWGPGSQPRHLRLHRGQHCLVRRGALRRKRQQ
jgi:hypothetical protein